MVHCRSTFLLLPLLLLAACHRSQSDWCSWQFRGCAPVGVGFKCEAEFNRSCDCPPSPKTNCTGPSVRYADNDTLCWPNYITCHKVSHWGQWGPWHPPIPKCGSYERSRTRICIDDITGKSADETECNLYDPFDSTQFTTGSKPPCHKKDSGLSTLHICIIVFSSLAVFFALLSLGCRLLAIHLRQRAYVTMPK